VSGKPWETQASPITLHKAGAFPDSTALGDGLNARQFADDLEVHAAMESEDRLCVNAQIQRHNV
jgi:hypothetical protein